MPTEIIIEPKVRWNSRRLPPPPPGLEGRKLAEWARGWRSLHKWFRYQVSEDERYWLSVCEVIGRAATESLLGEREDFRIDSLGNWVDL